MKILSALVAGLLFGWGLTVSQMINPQKVLGFLDITGQWDPSLIFVMAGGVLITAIGYKWVLKKPTPLYTSVFHIPSKNTIDMPLIKGAILFGVGWGLVGLCPGPAIAALGVGGPKALVFFLAMTVGMVVHELKPGKSDPAPLETVDA